MTRFKVGDRVNYVIGPRRSTPREVLEVGRQMLGPTYYKFEEPTAKGGFIWTPEWMLELDEA